VPDPEPGEGFSLWKVWAGKFMSAVGHWRQAVLSAGPGSEIDECVSRGNESIGRKQSSFSGYFPTIAFTAAEKLTFEWREPVKIIRGVRAK